MWRHRKPWFNPQHLTGTRVQFSRVSSFHFSQTLRQLFFDESHLPLQRGNGLFSHTHDTVGEQCCLRQSCLSQWHRLNVRGEKKKMVLFSGRARSCDRGFLSEADGTWKGQAPLQQITTSQAWTYNLVGWGGAGDITLDLPSLPSGGVLDWITGDDGWAWEEETERQ